jgi:hypothetical protein
VEEGATHSNVNKIFRTVLNLFSLFSRSKINHNCQLVHKNFVHVQAIIFFSTMGTPEVAAGAAWVAGGTAVVSVSHPFPIISGPAQHQSPSPSSQSSTLNPQLGQPSSATDLGDRGSFVGYQTCSSAFALAENNAVTTKHNPSVCCHISIIGRHHMAGSGHIYEPLPSNGNFCRLATPCTTAIRYGLQQVIQIGGKQSELFWEYTVEYLYGYTVRSMK